jgi:hypothetical protein
MNCDKRRFETEQEAIDFELEHHKIHGGLQQHAYPCEVCPGGAYHLTSSPNGNASIAQVRYENRTPPNRREWSRELTEAEKESIRAEYNSDSTYSRGRKVTRASLAKKYNTSVGRIHAATIEKVGTAQITTMPSSLESFEDEVKAAEERLRLVREKKQKFIDESSLKLIPLDGGRFQIKRQFQGVILTADECIALIEMLEKQVLQAA